MVELDIEEYEKWIQDLSFSVVSHITLPRGAIWPTNQSIKQKLLEAWNISHCKVIPYGKGLYHIVLFSMEDQAAAMIQGAVNLHPSVIRVHRWYLGYTPVTHRQTTLQVWVCIFYFP